MKKNLRIYFFRYYWLVFLLFLIIVFAWPYLFAGKTPFPSSYQINHFQPWSNIQEFWGPVKNGAMPDIVDQIYPWRHFSVERWKEGGVALWNPNSFAGTPHLANFQSSVFSPINILFVILPFLQAWTLLIILQPLIAGLGMFIFLRSYKRSDIGALIGSVSFMFCGFIVVWMAYGTLAMAISVLPLAMLGAKKFAETGKVKFGFIVAATLAFSFFSGHFQTSLYLLSYLLIFIVFLSRKSLFKKSTIYLFGFVVLGLCISLIQLIPTIQFYLLSVRSGSFITGGGIPFDHLITLVAPDFFGNPVTRNDWVGSYAEWAIFVGIVPLFLGFLSLFKKTPVIKFVWTMVIIISVLAIASPIQNLIGMLHLPVISTSNPSRIVVLLSFTLAFLSAFGFDTLLEKLKSGSVKTIFYSSLFLGAIFLIVWILLLIKPFPDPYSDLAMKNFILPTLILATIFAVIVLAYVFRKNKLTFLLLGLALLGMASFDSLRFSTKWMPLDPQDKVFVDLPVIDKMQQEVGQGRMLGNLGAQVTTYYNIPGLEGYDPLYIGRYGEFIRASIDGKPIDAERSVVKLFRQGKYVDRVIDLLGVEVVFHPIADTNQPWAYPVWEDLDRYKEIYRDKNFQVFRNNTAIKRGTLYYDFEIAKDREILEKFYAPDFDFRTKLILEESPGIEPSQDQTHGRVRVLKDDPENVVFAVISDRPGLLFLADNFYPGWKAKVNGQDVKIYRANYTFRSVEVPEGESEVEFYYTPIF